MFAKIHPPEDATLIAETELLPRLREMKLRTTAQSEGYETMTQHSSEDMSEVFTHFHIYSKYLILS